MPGLLFGMFRIPTRLRALLDPEYHIAKSDTDITRIPADFLSGRLCPSSIIITVAILTILSVSSK